MNENTMKKPICCL